MSAPEDPGAVLGGRRVAVVGAGRTGVAVARFSAAHRASVVLLDEKPADQLGPALAGLPPEVQVIAGPLSAAAATAALAGAELMVLSPGVPPAHPVIAAVHKSGVPLTGEVELAARFLAAPLVAITGTNGKSTVTSLCGEIARATGRPTFVGGNLGTPLIEAVGTACATQQGLVVCEVSSYQLETTERFHPRAAALLNLTADHLDRHRSMEAYGDAKLRITRNLGPGDVLVHNLEDPALAEAVQRNLGPGGGHLTLGYQTEGAAAGIGGSGGFGGLVEGRELVLRLPGAGGEPTEERYPTADLALVGRHNLGNALAAYLLLRGAGLASPAAVTAGARAFRPLPHRMELVGERAGVRYYDDSKGTNVAAVVASIDGFPCPFVLIAGGRDKGGSYQPLRQALARNPSRGVVVLGEAAERIAAALEGAVEVVGAASMEEAVARAARLAAPGEAVVLSPACSSFDMFRDYHHRGLAFRAAVENLPATR